MYLLEGNIGVGKSTFLKKLKEFWPEVEIVPEPLNNWANQKYGKSLLEQFYQEPKRWAFTIETLAMMSRFQDHVAQQDTKQACVMERSIYSGHYCFALNGKEQDFFTHIEWNMYLEWIDFLVHQRCKAPKGFIYLQADPTICLDRVKIRKRASEAGLPLEYMKQIHHKHESFLINKDDVFESIKKVPVLTLDCSKSFVDNNELFAQHVERVKEFIEETK